MVDNEQLGLIVIWLLLGALVGRWAANWGRSFAVSMLLSIVLSPLIAAIILLISGKDEKVVAAATSVARPDAVSSLQALADLRDRGASTNEEFETKKLELLSRV